jgi:hypothetical protein
MLLPLVLLLLSFSPAEISVSKEINIYEAIASRYIKLNIKSQGGYRDQSLVLEIENISPAALLLKVEPGTMFGSEEEWVQDLVVVQTALLALQPGKKGSVSLHTMCTQAKNHSPSPDDRFLLASRADGHLLNLVRMIDRENYQNSTAQSAVWAITGQSPLSYIYGEDVNMVKKLCEVVSQATGKPCEAQNFTPRRHQLTSFKSSLEILLPEAMPEAMLVAFDQQGNRFMEYFQNFSLKPGFYQFKVGLNHTYGDSATFRLVLYNGQETIAEKWISLNDTMPNMQKTDREVTATWVLNQEARVRVGIYDAEGQLYILLAEGLSLRKGMHRMVFTGGRELPFGKSYFFKVMDGDRELISQPYALDTTPKDFEQITRRGTFTTTLKQPVAKARLIITDQQGKTVWSVFEGSSLSAGYKSIPWLLQHNQGPAVPFSLVLIDETTGETLHTQAIPPTRR